MLSLILNLLRLLPLSVLYVIADYVVFPLLYYVSRYRRSIVEKNVAFAFPDLDDVERKKLEIGFYHFMSDFFAEVVYLQKMDEVELDRRLVFKNPDLVNDLVFEGNWVMCYMGHYANWEWLLAAAGRKLRNAAFIYSPLHNESVNTRLRSARERLGAKGIPIDEVSSYLSSKITVEDEQLKQSGVVIVIADQLPKEQYVRHFTRFMGIKSKVITGTESIVRRYGMIPIYCKVVPTARGYYECEFVPIHHAEQESCAKNEFTITDCYFAMLQQQIMEKPELWLWTHDRWRR